MSTLVGFSKPSNTGGADIENKNRIYNVKILVTFHVSPSYPRTGRGSNTFLEREQKLYIVQSPEHRMKGRDFLHEGPFIALNLLEVIKVTLAQN